MIRNTSKENVTLKWDGITVVLKPKEEFDVRDFNVKHAEVPLVEAKLGAKHSGFVTVVHTKEELMSREELRKQQEEFAKKEKELEDREAAVTEREKKAK